MRKESGAVGRGGLSIRMYDPVRKYSSGRKVQYGYTLRLCETHYDKLQKQITGLLF